jgi:molybdopterin molybdotransferase
VHEGGVCSRQVVQGGDEIREPGSDLPPGCVYDANRYALMGLLEALGCRVDDLGILPDRYQTIHDELAGAADTHDAIVTTGGVSAGEEDHVRAAVSALGAIHFSSPSAPAARAGRAMPPSSIRCNPAKKMVTFLRWRGLLASLPAAAITLTTFRVRPSSAIRRNPREWVRCRLREGADGERAARKFPREGASILTCPPNPTAGRAAEDLTRLEAGTAVDFLPLEGVDAGSVFRCAMHRPLEDIERRRALTRAGWWRGCGARRAETGRNIAQVRAAVTRAAPPDAKIAGDEVAPFRR